LGAGDLIFSKNGLFALRIKILPYPFLRLSRGKKSLAIFLALAYQKIAR